MAKKVSDIVIGMLSDAGSATRAPVGGDHQPADPPSPRASPVSPPAPPRHETVAAPPVKPAEPPPPANSDSPEAPRTLRLRPEAATRLRAAWLEAKRDDVLLTAQDFASELVIEALVSRRRRRTPTPA